MAVTAITREYFSAFLCLIEVNYSLYMMSDQLIGKFRGVVVLSMAY